MTTGNYLVDGILKVLMLLASLMIIGFIIYFHYTVRWRYQWYRRTIGGIWYGYADKDGVLVYWSQDNSISVLTIQQTEFYE